MWKGSHCSKEKKLGFLALLYIVFFMQSGFSLYSQDPVIPHLERHGNRTRLVVNGDQTHQGRHIRIFKDNYSIPRFELYNYE